MAEKVLIIDDEPETVRLISLVLQRQGFNTAIASNGAEGIEKSENENPDLILLDVMMPDMDGYDVCRKIRANRQTANIPILMFSAKGQVQDRVAGYEAGIDDFITKPIHPAELVTRVKALLARPRPAPIPDFRLSEKSPAYTIGIIAPRGGMGSSTLTLNLGIQLFQTIRKDILCIELRPGHGSFAVALGLLDNGGLARLLRMDVKEITPASIEKEIIHTSYGPQLLVASNSIQDNHLMNATAQIESVIKLSAHLSPVILLDIGTNLLTNFETITSQCKEIILLTEPFHSSIDHTILLKKQLETLGFGKTKLLSLVQYNHIRSDIQLTANQVKEMLGRDITQLVSAAPELAYYAELNTKPMTIQQPESLFTQQISQLAKKISERIPNE